MENKDLFISYSSKNRTIARKLVKVLENKGWNVWWDKKILPGTAFDKAIENALDRANWIIVLWSTTAVKSSWVLEEAYEGLQRNILIPILVEKVEIPFGYRRLQYIDFRRWKGGENSVSIKKLLSKIEQNVEKNKKKSKPKKVSSPKKIKRTFSGSLDGKTIVFTGALLETRNAHAEKVRVVGANFVNSVSGNTDYLVVGKEPGAVKLKAAENYGTKKITERQWHNLLNKTYKRTLVNKIIVFVGKLQKNRKDLEKITKKLGASFSSTITKSTDYIIVGKNPSQLKLDKAAKYAVHVLQESLWNEIVETL